MRKTLILINSEKELAWSLEYKKEHRQEEVIICSSTFEGQYALQKNNLKNEEFYQASDFPRYGIIKLSEYLSIRWYKQSSSLKQELDVLGVNLGKVMETSLFFFFLESLRSLITLKNIIEYVKPQKIVFNSTFNKSLRGSLVKDIRLESLILQSLKKQYPDIVFLRLKVNLPKDNTDILSYIIKRTAILLADPISYLSLVYTFILSSLFKNVKRNSEGLRKILIFAQRNHFTNFLNFINLVFRSKFEVKIISSALLKSHLLPIKTANIPYTLLESARSKEILSAVTLLSNNIRKIWKKCKKEDILEGLLNKTGVPEIAEIIYLRLDEFFNKELEENIANILVASKIIDQFKPDLIITMTDTTPKDMAFVLEGKNKRIKTLLLQHGFLIYRPILRANADYIASWGNLAKEWWVKKIGKESKKVFVTGYPYFDKYTRIKPIKPIRPQTNRSKGLNILLLTAYIPGHEEKRFKLFSSYLKEIGEFADVNLTIRTLTGKDERDTTLLKFLKTFDYPIKLDSRLEVDAEVSKADAVLAEGTSLMFDALIMGKPVIYLNYGIDKNLWPFAKSGAALGAYKAGDIIKAINSLRLVNLKEMEKERRKFILDNCYKIDGKSSQRVLALIKRLTDRKD